MAIKCLFLLRFTGRVLSVTWSADANYIYSGSSDGYVLNDFVIDKKITLCAAKVA